MNRDVGDPVGWMWQTRPAGLQGSSGLSRGPPVRSQGSAMVDAGDELGLRLAQMAHIDDVALSINNRLAATYPRAGRETDEDEKVQSTHQGHFSGGDFDEEEDADAPEGPEEAELQLRLAQMSEIDDYALSINNRLAATYLTKDLNDMEDSDAEESDEQEEGPAGGGGDGGGGVNGGDVGEACEDEAKRRELAARLRELGAMDERLGRLEHAATAPAGARGGDTGQVGELDALGSRLDHVHAETEASLITDDLADGLRGLLALKGRLDEVAGELDESVVADPASEGLAVVGRRATLHAAPHDVAPHGCLDESTPGGALHDALPERPSAPTPTRMSRGCRVPARAVRPYDRGDAQLMLHRRLDEFLNVDDRNLP